MGLEWAAWIGNGGCCVKARPVGQTGIQTRIWARIDALLQSSKTLILCRKVAEVGASLGGLNVLLSVSYISCPRRHKSRDVVWDFDSFVSI